MFDWEHGITLHAMQGNRASSRGEGKSHCSPRVAAGTWGIFSSYGRDDTSKLVFVQQREDSCLVTRDTSGFSSMLDRAIQILLEVRQETQGTFPVATVILGFLSIFNKCQAYSPFEALNSVCLSRCQKDVRPPVKKRGVLWLSLGSPQGIETSLHLVRLKTSLHSIHCREIRPSFESGHLDVHSTSDSRLRVSLSIPFSEGRLLLRCLWKVGLPLQSKPGNQLSSQDDMGFTELSSSCCTETGVPLDLRRVSQGISGVA